MTLGELKKEVAKLLEEYSANGEHFIADSDYKLKMINAINVVNMEVSKVQGILKEIDVVADYSEIIMPEDCRLITEIEKLGMPFSNWAEYGNKVNIYDAGNFKIKYNAYPPIYKESSDNEEILPFKDSALLPYGVCKLLLLGTGDTSTALEFEQKYYTLMQELQNTAGKRKVKVIKL